MPSYSFSRVNNPKDVPHADTPAGDHPKDMRLTPNMETGDGLFVTSPNDKPGTYPRTVLGTQAKYWRTNPKTDEYELADLPDGEYIIREQFDDPASWLYLWFEGKWWEATEDIYTIHRRGQNIFDAAEEMGYDSEDFARGFIGLYTHE